MKKNVLLIGRPGVGKTTVIEAVLREFRNIAAGFTTAEIPEGWIRKGFRVTSLAGESAIMAHVDFKGLIRVGHYGVDLSAFERIALPALRAGLDRAQIISANGCGRSMMVAITILSEDRAYRTAWQNTPEAVSIFPISSSLRSGQMWNW